MFNNQMFNEHMFNAIVASNSESIDWDIVYNGYVLHKRDTVYASSADFYNTPTIQDETYDIPNDNGIGLLDYKYRKRTIRIQGTINKSNNSQLVTEINEMKKALWEPNKVVQIVFGGVPRRATGYVSNLSFEQNHYNIRWTRYTVDIVITDPFFENIKLLTSTFASITSTFSESELNRGTTTTPAVFSMTFFSATSVDEITITMWDTWVTINETISWWDIIKVDWREKKVTINGNAVDYTGVLPIMQLGSNTYTIEVNGTYEYTLNLQHKLRFI